MVGRSVGRSVGVRLINTVVRPDGRGKLQTSFYFDCTVMYQAGKPIG